MNNSPTDSQISTIDKPDSSLAILGLITASIISVFQADGSYTPTDSLIGVLLICIVEAYKTAIPNNWSGKIAFSMVKGAAVLIFLAGLSSHYPDFIQMQLKSSQFIFPAIWAALSILFLFGNRKLKT